MTSRSDPVTVLIVDGEPGTREGSKRILDRLGCRTLMVGRGDEVLGILEKEDVAVILLDLEVPGMDGMEVLGIVTDKYPWILVVVMTGFGTIETVVETMRKGACDFIPKPFEPDQLALSVNRAVQKVPLDKVSKLDNEPMGTMDVPVADKSRIHTILDSLPIGVLVTDTQGRVVLLNPAFRRQVGLADGIATGCPVEDVIADDGVCRLVAEISKGRHVGVDEIPPRELMIGNQLFLQARSCPIKGDPQEGLGAVVTFVDITAMKVMDRLKSEFVAKVSHELRSPLSTIHEQLAVVLSDMAGRWSDKETHLLSRAKEKTEGLISLIGDLLDLSRIESGAVCEAPKPVLLDELFENIIDFLSTRAAAKQQALVLTQPKEPLPPVNADPPALESIFGNLISNALNYTQDGGCVEVRLSQAGNHVQVEVIDNGFGIESRHLDKIFDRFYRVKTEKTRYITGTGLGLPIVKGLVDSLGGRIGVESTPDKGSTFKVLLPAAEAAAM
jgi:PAS domain S-box-containing protein